MGVYGHNSKQTQIRYDAAFLGGLGGFCLAELNKPYQNGCNWGGWGLAIGVVNSYNRYK